MTWSRDLEEVREQPGDSWARALQVGMHQCKGLRWEHTWPAGREPVRETENNMMRLESNRAHVH